MGEYDRSTLCYMWENSTMEAMKTEGRAIRRIEARLGSGSSGRGPDRQAQGPEFKFQHGQKTKPRIIEGVNLIKAHCMHLWK
jgi:hypothetical protein